MNYCLTPVNACKVICIPHGDGHEADEHSPAVKAMVNILSDSLKTSFCELCDKSMDTWETRCLFKLFNNAFFWE